MRHLALVFAVSVALVGACVPEEDEAVTAESAEALEISGPIFARQRITAISPTSAAPGATVTITGTGFDILIRGPAAFGSSTSTAARANVTYVSPTQLTVVVPAGAQQGPIYLLSAFAVIGQSPPVQLTSPQIFTPLVAPAAPSTLTARVVSSSRSDLTWSDNSWNETGFDIWILDANGWRSLRTVGANRTGEAITGLLPATSYSFRVRAQNATGSSGFSNTVNATTPASLGTVVLTNNAQISVTEVTFNGVARSATSVSGNQATFTIAPGAYSVSARLTLATGDWVCSLGGNTTVIENQTSNLSLAPLTAGQVLTHCLGSIDYTQGSYVDAAGFHTVAMRFRANNTFDWWLDNAQQIGGTVTSTTFSEPWLTFTLSSGDTISMGWPFGSIQIFVNGFAVQMTRASGW